MSTLAQLRTQAKTRYRDLSNTYVTDLTWSDLLNEGYSEAAAASPFWPFLETKSGVLTVLAGSNEVALPAGGWRVQAVYSATDKLPLSEMQGRRSGYDAFPTQAEARGVPELYRVFNNKLQVFPWADVNTDLVVEYAAAPAPLADADSPVFPAQYHPILLHYALEQAFRGDGEHKTADHHESRWRSILGQMQTDLLGARGDGYPGIVDVGW